jgi:hypothetical protein
MLEILNQLVYILYDGRSALGIADLIKVKGIKCLCEQYSDSNDLFVCKNVCYETAVV